MADDATNKNRVPAKKKWLVAVGNRLAYRIRQEKKKAQTHNCGLGAAPTVKLPSRSWSEEMAVSQDSPDTVKDAVGNHVHNAGEALTDLGEYMMSGALVEADDGNFVPEKDVLARNGALACYLRFGGASPPNRFPPAHNRPRCRPASQFQSCETPTTRSLPVPMKDLTMTKSRLISKGISSRQISEEIQRQFGCYSWDSNGNGGRHSPVGGVSPRIISLDESFVQPALSTFKGNGGDPMAIKDAEKDVEMADAHPQKEIAIATIETLPAPAPASAQSTVTISVQEADLDLLNMLVNDNYGGCTNVEERDLWGHIEIGLRFGDVAAGSKVAEGLWRVYVESV